MDATLAQLAATGAQTIVILMATDAWNGTVHRVSNIFKRAQHLGSNDPGEELAASRRRIIAAKPGTEPVVIQQEQDRWEAYLRLMLLEDPSTSSLIASLIEEFGTTNSQPMTNLGNLTLRAEAKGHSRVYQQGFGVQRNE